MFIFVALSNSKFNFKVFLSLIFHPAGNARELVKLCVGVCACQRGGKPQERLVQQGCLQGQGTRPGHSESGPTSRSATRDCEEYPAESLSEEEGMYLESR